MMISNHRTVTIIRTTVKTEGTRSVEVASFFDQVRKRFFSTLSRKTETDGILRYRPHEDSQILGTKAAPYYSEKALILALIQFHESQLKVVEGYSFDSFINDAEFVKFAAGRA